MNRKHRRKSIQGLIPNTCWRPRFFGRILTDQEQVWCNVNFLLRGVDTDATDQQHSHLVCTLYNARWHNPVEPICGAQTLWFVTGEFGRARADHKTFVEEDNRISCRWCLEKLAEMRKKGTVLL